MTANVEDDTPDVDVDVEGFLAKVAPSTEEDEIIEVDDTLAQVRKEIKELRERLLGLRKQAKNAPKQERRALQEAIVACERKEADKRQFLEQELNKVRRLAVFPKP